MRRLLTLPLVLACAFLLSACQQQVLYSGLTEQEANEIMALLYASDLPASKSVENGGAYRVNTQRDAFADAMTLLQAHGLPRQRFDSLGKVFAKEGFVSSPLEERARLNHALSQEISHTISNIDGVVMARVHLAVPEREPLAERREPSSASVFVKHRPEVDLTQSVPKIKSLVVDGVENLPYENVTVSLFAAASLQQSRITKPKDGYQVLRTATMPMNRYSAWLLATGLIVFSLVAILIRRRNRLAHGRGTGREPFRDVPRQ